MDHRHLTSHAVPSAPGGNVRHRRRHLVAPLRAGLALVLVAASVLVAVPVGAQESTEPAFHVLDNGRLRFGGGGAGTTEPGTREASIDAFGNLRQPFYRSGSGNWYQLTYSTYPLDIAIGTGTSGSNWSTSTPVDNPLLTGQAIDASGFVTTSTASGGAIGHGRLRSTGTMNVNGADLEVSNTYELGENASFVRITTRVANASAAPAENVNLWVGTRDDYVGTNDGPTKTKGNLVDGAFVPTDDPAMPSRALRITSAAEGVLFYSTTPGTNTAINRCCSFRNAYDTAPTASETTATHDGSYALHLPVGDLAAEAATEIVWYYAAGSLAELEQVVRDVADAAAPPQPVVTIGDGQVTVTWDAPASEDPITDYLIRYSADGGETWTQIRRGSVAAPLAQVITGLQNGTSYRFEVAAVTGTGEHEVIGAWSPTSDVVVPGVPSNHDAPTIGGDAVVGATLTAVDPDSAWTNNGSRAMTASYRWQADGVDIDGATGTSLVVTADLVGRTLSVVATRTNEVGATDASSEATAVVPEVSLLEALDLGVGTLEPAFAPGTTRYQVTLPADTSTLPLTFVPAAEDATITVDGVPIPGTTHVAEIGPGTTTFEVRVTSHGRATEYVVEVTREAPEPPVPAGDPEPVRGPNGDLPPVGAGFGNIGGRPTPVVVTRERNGVDVRGEGFGLHVAPQDDRGTIISPDDEAAALAVVRGSAARLRVDGFAPSSTVRLWLFSTPTLLGEFETDEHGRLDVTTAGIPADVNSCQHTLHAEGVLPGGEQVEVSLGVWIDAVPPPFTDVVTGSPHARAVSCLADLGVIRGKSASRFDEVGALERGQAAALVSRMLGLRATAAVSFADVRGSAHATDVAASVEAGMLEGYRDGTFRPDQPITRGQLATLLARAAGLDTELRSAFADTDGSVHAGAIAALADAGYVAGFGDGTFGPNRAVTRGQAASMLLRVRERVLTARDAA